MFTLCHSNHLDLLEKVAATIMSKQPLSRLFAPEVFVVQSHGMANWLQLELASDLKIAANLSFLFPGQFIWQTYRQILPDIPKESAFERDALVWKLLTLLPDICELPQFTLLKEYLKDQTTPQKYYFLARSLAELYDRYLMYRPDWILTWEKGERIDANDRNEKWQAMLWQKIKQRANSLAQSTAHRATIYQHFLNELAIETLSPQQVTELPERIFIFGISSLPPAILSTLAALGKHIDVYLMLTNPCRWYWGEIPEDKWRHKLIQKKWHTKQASLSRPLLKIAAEEAPTEDEGYHPLLSLLGKLGRDTLFLLQEFEHKNDIDLFSLEEPKTVLTKVQYHILELTNKAVIGQDAVSFASSHNKITFARSDFSISFHSCHSALREVEVLYNALLHQFDIDPALSLRDVIVMMPNIDTYAYAIKAVFGNAPKERYLPFSICDQNVQHLDSNIKAFLLLLALPTSCFTTEDVFNLLAASAIAERFGISDSELAELKEWCIDCGICWGLSEKIQRDYGLDKDSQFTWDAGLERLLLGSIMQESASPWHGVAPFSCSAGLAAESVGKLATFIAALQSWQKILSQRWTLPEWQTLGRQLLPTFFKRSQDTEAVLTLLEQDWQAFLETGITQGYSEPLPIEILKQGIQERLTATRLEQRFLTGKINFCTLLPMRGIPFKQIYLLGMNDIDYPRFSATLNFDLMAQRPRRGDRNRRDDDQYLFLEALLSAQDRLYISYIGQDIVDNSQHYPSVLVDALRDYIGQAFVLDADKDLDIDESYRRVIQHLTQIHPRTPYDRRNYQISLHNNWVGNYMEEWLYKTEAKTRQHEFHSLLKPATKKNVTIEALKDFYGHSIRHFMKTQLDIYYKDEIERLPTSEHFALEGLTRYGVNKRLLDGKLSLLQSSMDIAKSILAEGKLPYGVFGEIVLDEVQRKLKALVKRIPLNNYSERQQEDIKIILKDGILQGQLSEITAQGILKIKPGIIAVKDRISLWIDHLILSIVRPGCGVKSLVYDLENHCESFVALDQEEAKEILCSLVGGYFSGLVQPLLLPVKSAWSWLEKTYNSQTGQIELDKGRSKKGRLALIQTWQGNSRQRAECDDYYRRMIPELTEIQIVQIEDNISTYLLPLRRLWSD